MTSDKKDDLLLRWNRAMAKWCSGSEFHNDPERCAEQIQRVMNFREELAHRKGERGLPLRAPTPQSPALRAAIRLRFFGNTEGFYKPGEKERDIELAKSLDANPR